MRTISLCLLSTISLSWCLACHSVQTLESAELPAATRDPLTLAPALDDTPNFRSLFYPGTPPNSLLAVIGSSASGSPSPPDSPQLGRVQNSAGITVARETTSYVEPEPVSDTPEDFSTTAWASPKFFTDLSTFNVSHFVSGRDNLEVVVGITPGVEDIVHADDTSSWINASAMLQLFYPKDSVNPARRPQGGSEFYAKPLDISKATNVTLEYKVFFPGNFDWVKGGKLPGLYGGHTRCSGGNSALDCFSTRLMWRAGGAGELYLYAPKDRQTASLCMTPPQTVCDQTYGLSIGRGSFSFSRGTWTHVSQTVVLNTPGVQDGGFILEVDGRVAINRTDVFYRDKPLERDHIPTPFCDPNSQPDDSLLGPLLGGLIGSGIESERDGAEVLSPRVPLEFSTGFVATVPYDASDANAQSDSPVKPKPLENNDDLCVGSEEGRTQETVDPVGFQGVFFSTFFGGHRMKFATPKDQFVWFKDFALYINDL